ncbi:MAG TPA: magnesium transporter CorA family protein [Candidatus Limnocylindrales bacterium]|nr:magnesium transporter CorA family protein [Candidatus Limnocylindrales bacterium]
MKVLVLQEHELKEASASQLPALLESGAQIWVDMLRPDEAEIALLRDTFHFHPLAIDDVINMRQRPKVEDYGEVLFTITNPVHFDGRDASFTELDLFLGPNFIVTVHKEAEEVVDLVMKSAAKRTAFGEQLYVALILYLLVDVTVDGYFPVLDAFSDELDTLSDHLVLKPDPVALQRVFELRRMLMEFTRVLGQQRDMFTLVLRDHQPFVTDSALRYYMRDVYDHVLRLNDSIALIRDEAASAVELYFSSQSNKLNVFIQKLTIITVGVGVLTVIGGFYGMNFLHTFPGFDERWGVPFVLLLMLGVAAATYYALRRIRPN